jgi:polar amino acid transport system substrate-binding protein
MKRLSIILIGSILVLTMLLSACSSPKASSDTITVVTDPTFAPFESMDDNGNMVGLDIDLMNKVAEDAGLTIKWENVPFDSIIAGLTECQYKVAIAAIYIRDDRKQTMTFTDPYMTAGLIVAVNKKDTSIKSIDDLVGKTVAAQLGTSGEVKAQAIKNVTYKPYDSYELAFMDLANGQVDAVIADNPVAENYVKTNPDKLKLVGDVFDAEPYGIAFCKTDTALRDKVNTSLNKLIKSGYVDELIKKYMK